MSRAGGRRLNLVGAGRVGLSLAALWQDAGQFTVQDICTRSLSSAQAAAQRLGSGRAVADAGALRPAEVWLLAVPDDQLGAAASRLADLPLPPATAWHCSGFHPASVLRALQARGWTIASAHPALSFADTARARAQFAGSACALEGDEAAVRQAEASLSAIGGRCFRLRSEDKPLYHAAAVFSSNFMPVLQASAADLWRVCGMPEELIQVLWRDFLRKGSANLLEVGPVAALTGPAARGDAAVVAAETRALDAHDALLAAAYASLSSLASRLAAQRRG